MEKSQDCNKVGRATKSGLNIPDSFTVDGVDGRNQGNESYVKILVLFLTFLLNLTGKKIMSVVPRDVLKPHWLSGSMSSDNGSKRLGRTRASIFPAMERRAMSR